MVRRLTLLPRWARWRITAYYAPDVEPPKQPGELAGQVVVAHDWMRDLEVEVSEGRADIGSVVVERVGV